MKISRYISTISLLVFLAAPGLAQVNDVSIVPVVGSTPGAAGTYWSSSVYLFNPQPHSLVISVTFLGTGGAIGDEILVHLPSNATAIADDVLVEWFDTTGTGSLLFAVFPEDNPDVEDSVLARSFLVRSRTYNDDFGGTYGQGIPGEWVGLFDFAFDGITSIAQGVWNVGVPGVSGYRTNVGAINLGDESVFLLVTVYDDAGNVVDDTFDAPLEFFLPPYGHMQDQLPTLGRDLTLEFLVDDPTQEAVVFPYVSIVDNLSGDAVYVNPRLLADPAILYKGAVAASANVTVRSGERLPRLREKAPNGGRESGVIALADARKLRERTERSAEIRDGIRIPLR